ncbi:cotranscriptional regulator FAM172A isoform X2 [Lagopus muta]|uniref:cotranscriptional regulator FAM172A isoform X2 n=1 Tax=Lagopus muta TaxID=64668 RepID=UPI00209CF07D|nr:cotranscriptional regulator FAM172A isoform X2 [Lagopus muta]
MTSNSRYSVALRLWRARIRANAQALCTDLALCRNSLLQAADSTPSAPGAALPTPARRPNPTRRCCRSTSGFPAAPPGADVTARRCRKRSGREEKGGRRARRRYRAPPADGAAPAPPRPASNGRQIITKHVYGLLEKECHLKKITLPVDAAENEPKSFIFMSEDALTNPDKLLVLIHGNGVVRAGQWARRLIINEDLDSGTQIPYIKKAIEEGYGVIVLNPNENYIEVEKTKAQVQLSSDSSDEPAEKRERKDKIQKETKKRRDFYEKYRNPQKEKETIQMYIRDNGSPEEHAIYVWDHFISQSAAENVFFVAHSYGGLAFVELMIQREAEVKNKVTAVALTDSVHNVWHQEAGKTIREWMRENCCNWVSSSEPLDTSVESMLPDCPRVSAGTERHELTSWKSFPSIFKFFSEAVEAKNSSVKPAPMRRSNRIKYEEL